MDEMTVSSDEIPAEEAATDASPGEPGAPTPEAYAQQVAELNAVARAHLAKGEWEPAVEGYKEAIALAEATDDVGGKAEATNNIASVFLALQDWEQAMSYATQARELYQGIEDRSGEAVVLNNVAAAYDGMGDWQQGLETYEAALAIRQDLGDQEGEAKTLRNLAILYAQHGNRPKAKSYLNRALVAARQSKSRQLLADIRKTMSQLPKMRR